MIFSEPGRRLCELLNRSIEQAYQRGRRIFLNGAMMGFDVLAAEQVIAAQKKFPDIKCVTIGPFQTGFFLRNGWTPKWKRRAIEVFRCSDYGFSLYDNYFPGVYYRRNEFLVEHASELICYWDGGNGGTSYTCRYAQEKIPVYNLATPDGLIP